MKRLLAAPLLVLAHTGLRAQTVLPSGIYTNTTLTLANSPYRAASDLTVFEGVALTLEPGVELRVDSSFRINVRGALVAQGTAAQKIFIHGNTTGGGYHFWEGIKFGTTPPVFSYCILSNAHLGIDLYNADRSATYAFRNCLFTANYMVEDNASCRTVFDGCEFSHNNQALGGFGSATGSAVKNCLFDANHYGSPGADTVLNCEFKNHDSYALNPYGYTAYCYIHDNDQGVYSNFNSVNNAFINNRVVNNREGVTINTYFDGLIDFRGNTICGNSYFNVAWTKGNNIKLPGNCWCSTDSATIRNTILDGYKDVNRGLIQFAPWSTACPAAFLSAAPAVPEGSFSIAPNPVPVGGVLAIRWPAGGSDAGPCAVSDLLGRPVLHDVVATGPGYRSLRLHAAPGVYLVTVPTPQAEGGSRTARVLVVE